LRTAPIARRFRPFQGTVPERISRSLTPSRLEREGFGRVAKGCYRKDFSSVLRLTIGLGPGRKCFYNWSIDAKRLRKVIDELETLKGCLDREVRRLYRKWMRARAAEAAKDKGTKDQDGVQAVIAECVSARQKIRAQGTALREKYRDFMDLFTYTGGDPRLYGCSCFPLEACSTTKDLRMYFDFAKLYLDVYAGLEKSKTGKASSRERTESVIQAYYAVLYAIRKIRKRDDEIRDPEALAREFPEIPECLVHKILLPGKESSRKWAHRASKLALRRASRLYGTTSRNLRDLLTKNRAYAVIAQDYFATLKEPERLVFGGGSPRDLLPAASVYYGRQALLRMIRSFLIGP
jgi:hypothetical protein